VSDHLPELLAAANNPEVSQAARAVLSEVTGDVHHLRGMVSDQFGYWRLKRLNRLAEKAGELAGADMRLSPIALRTLVPLLDAGTIEEDDDMQDRWAALLASAGLRPDAIPPSFVEILRALSPEEAQVLDDIADGRLVIEDPDPPPPLECRDGTLSVRMRVPWMMDLDYPDPDSPEARINGVLASRHPRLRMWLTNLDRMGLTTCRPGRGDRGPIESVAWGLTTLGRCFVDTCRAPRVTATDS
jgi:hypothetical protein